MGACGRSGAGGGDASIGSTASTEAGAEAGGDGEASPEPETGWPSAQRPPLTGMSVPHISQ